MVAKSVRNIFVLQVLKTRHKLNPCFETPPTSEIIKNVVPF